MRFVVPLLVSLLIVISGCTQTAKVAEREPQTLDELFNADEDTPMEQLDEEDREPAPPEPPPPPAPADPCDGITCQDSSLTCPDDFLATCENSCSEGRCSACKPDCSAHPCLEAWDCSAWSECNGEQTRSCTDTSECGTTESKPAEKQSCEAVVSVTIHSIEPVEEIVEITNSGTSSADMTNWTLHDDTSLSSHVFTFHAFTLEPGSTVRIHKGIQENTQTDLYWGNNLNIWNNDGDIATLSDTAGTVVSRYEY